MVYVYCVLVSDRGDGCPACLLYLNFDVEFPLLFAAGCHTRQHISRRFFQGQGKTLLGHHTAFIFDEYERVKLCYY
jgi:hypothetical protein